MRILSFKPGHDAAIAMVEDGRLVFSLEAEKGGFERHAELTPIVVLQALEMSAGPPDVLAVSGWVKPGASEVDAIGAGYWGLEAGTRRPGSIFGRPVDVFTSTHERAHIFMIAGMAPGAPLDECAILSWEGGLGNFYHWRKGGAEIERHMVLNEPGSRYAALFGIADPGFAPKQGQPPHEDAGKLMALAAYADGQDASGEERALVDRLLEPEKFFPFDKGSFRDSALHNCGVHTPAVHRAAAHLTDRIFETFRRAAPRLLPPGLPLLITGGCALNCDWNRRWHDSGLFSEVFASPCGNDSGSAIGTAVDALTSYGSPCALDWTVYSGAPFADDGPPPDGKWTRAPADPRALAEALQAGDVVAWVEGRVEIGPRALGHRSLLATPLDAASHERLNEIKSRESYRPIAPCCLSEDLELWFEDPIDDPYMLYVSRVKTDRLPAVTHVDGTARVQSVGPDGPPRLRSMLRAFREVSGVGVLCNTSLNFPGTGFLNTASDVFAYASDAGIEHVVIEDDWYTRAPA